MSRRYPPLADLCPCGRGEPYENCCAPLHRGDRTAPTAEALMRSRYTAFARAHRDPGGAAQYLTATWHASTRPARLDLPDGVEWTGLDIVGTSRGGPFDSDGTVTFAAHFRQGGVDGVQREVSRFVREDGRWSYVDGDL
ncbi:YchJ family metal-binding protein [Rhodococcus sp. HNM0569]|uniref:YchJ family protein n=1 Tax=Rhodococcus sp. HNM0569 TaxID=2716340 RepID=UPI003211F011